ncbi:MAG: peptidoglycan DD-metalloendopeptidase family protein, partial [Gemmatimonadales bacterium]
MRKVLLPVAFLIVATAAAFAGRGSWPWQRLEMQAPPVIVSRAFAESIDTLHQGETLSDLFARNRVAGLDLRGLAEELSLDLRRLRPGLEFKFRRDMTDSVPSAIRFRLNRESKVNLLRVSGNWTTESEPIAWTIDTVKVRGDIENSLYTALDDQVDDRLLDRAERIRMAWDLADTYMWQVDFTRDIRPGDRFNVVLEREVSELGEVRFGRILASELRIMGKDMAAFRFRDSEGEEEFYDDSGESLKRAFLRAPLQFRRISSNFNPGRRHPILNVVRAHKGTDYAANKGTPVMAAGNGKVVRAGWVGGYGRLIEIKHANGISTRYGHLNGFASGIRSGRHVSQGQT